MDGSWTRVGQCRTGDAQITGATFRRRVTCDPHLPNFYLLYCGIRNTFIYLPTYSHHSQTLAEYSLTFLSQYFSFPSLPVPETSL